MPGQRGQCGAGNVDSMTRVVAFSNWTLGIEERAAVVVWTVVLAETLPEDSLGFMNELSIHRRCTVEVARQSTETMKSTPSHRLPSGQ